MEDEHYTAHAAYMAGAPRVKDHQRTNNFCHTQQIRNRYRYIFLHITLVTSVSTADLSGS